MPLLPSAPPPSFNFAQHLLERNVSRAARTAYVDDHGSITYGELAERVRRMAAGLLALGLKREERVLLLMHDNIDWPVSFLGALYAGVVPVAVNTLLTPDDYAYMLQHSRAQAALVSAALLPTLQAAMEKGGHEVQHLLVSRLTTTLPTGAQAVETFIGAHPPLAKAAPTQCDEPAFWLYSSGSTGRPKGTVHTHANPYWTAELYAEPVLGMKEGDTVFSAAKLFFAYGLGNALSFPLSVGATVVLMAERPTPDACFKRLTEHKPTIFCRRAHGLCRHARLRRRCRRASRSRCGCAPRPARRCRARSASVSLLTSAARSSTASARPRCCTSSSPTARAACATAPPAGRWRATSSSCAARTAARCRPARSATSTSAARARR